jgi:UPF0716 protein FxsA
VLLRLLAALVLTPLVELVVLLWIADQTSWQTALAIILLGMAVGGWLIRRAGTHSLREIRGQRAPEEPPLSFSNAALQLVAGLLFLLPGVLSDLLAVGLLIPWTRRQLARWLLRSLGARQQTQWSVETRRSDRIIDVRVLEPRRGHDECRNPNDEGITKSK